MTLAQIMKLLEQGSDVLKTGLELAAQFSRGASIDDQEELEDFIHQLQIENDKAHSDLQKLLRS